MLIELSSPRRSHRTDRSPLRGTASALAPLVTHSEAVDFSRVLTHRAATEGGPVEVPNPVSMPAAEPVDVAATAMAVTAEPAAADLASSEGGFLAELEREARSQLVPDEPDRETLERNVRMANAACRAVCDYWARLAEHLNVLKPATPARYVFDGRTVLDRLPSQGFRVVPKLRTAHSGEEHFESVMLSWRVGKGERMKMVKDFPAEIDRLKARLSFAGISAYESQARDRETGRSRGMQFEFTADVSASVRVTPLHDEGKVRLTLLNLGALERIEAELPAFAMRAGELDDLARMICGRTNSLLKHAQNVVRHEP
jgi:hypothetical protein